MSMIGGMADAIEEHFGSGLCDASAIDGTARREGGGERGGAEAGGKARLLVLRGAGGKAFCAGGDVKAIAAE